MTEVTPPPVVETKTPYEAKYSYDIQFMIDNYGVNNLSMDNLIAYMAVPLAKAMFLRDTGSIGSESTIKDWVTRVINLYNSNISTIGGENMSSVGIKLAKDMRL